MYLKLKNTKGIISLLFIVEGFLFLCCAPIALSNNELLLPFIIPSVISFFVGGFMFFFSSKKIDNITSNKGNILLIIFTWIVVVFAGTLPFLLSNSIHSFADIFFETVSGLTSTGTSILSNPEMLPKSVLFWRSLSQWYGGILTIIMLLAVFPEINIGGYKIFSIEENKLYVITRVFVVYCVLTFIQVIFLFAGGISLYQSFCISFATLSTGCFLPDKTAVASFTPYIQLIMTVFMILSGFGGLFYYKLSRLNKPVLRKNEEFRFFILSFLIISILFLCILHYRGNFNPGKIIRESIFQAASFLSSSGYSVSEYSLWPNYFQPLLYLLIVVGGCTNSSSGGIKMSRFLILFRNIKRQFKNPLSDSDASEITLNGKKTGKEINLNILSFITIFGFVLVFGALVLTFITNDLEKSVFLTVTALSTFGHNINLSNLPHAGKLLLSLLMLIGRLEIFPFLVLLIPSFYKTPRILLKIKTNRNGKNHS